MSAIKLDVFGKMIIEIVRKNDQWLVFRLGNEGKKRMLDDIKIPSDLPESELVVYVADLYHEWATPNNHSITVL